MLYELHLSEVAPGRMPAVIDRFADVYIDLFRTHGIKPALFLESRVGAPSNRVTYLIPWNSLDEMERGWDGLAADPDYRRDEGELARSGPFFIQSTKTVFREVPQVMASLREAGSGRSLARRDARDSGRALLYETRLYEIAPGRAKAFTDRFIEHVIPLFQRLGVRAVLFLEPVIGTSNELAFVLEWENLGEREAKWSAVKTDPEWVAVGEATEKPVPIVLRNHSTIYRAVAQVMAKLDGRLA